MESFWHVLLWIALRHCDHRMNGMKLAFVLGSLFDQKYTNETGQAYSGGSKRDSLKSQSHITEMKLASKVLHTILVNTAQVLATRYPDSEVQDGILEVQRMWENLERESSTLDKEDLKAELLQRIAQMRNKALLSSYISWTDWRIMQDDVEWMEKIFEEALNDPTVDWNTGSDNIQHVLLRPSAPKSKRKSETDIDGRKPKKVSNLETLPEL